MKHRNSSQSVLACSRRANFSIVLTGNRAQFKFADGLRAVAAIGVALFHTYTYTGLSEQNQQLPVFFKILNLGDFAVAVFIVLSGFVLMLPVARTARFTVRGGIGQFLTRRARRILPPYYAAIVAFLIAILIIPGLNEKTGTAWDSKVPVSIDGIISHALMLHNLSPTWVYQIDGPAWSVATEWQIYFAMPLLLLPVWRHFGGRVAVVLAILIGWAVHFLLPQVDAAHYWFLGLFALGMAAGSHAYRGTVRVRGSYVVAAMLVTLLPAAAAFGAMHRFAWLSETAVGAAVALLLTWLAQRTVDGEQTRVHRMLEWRPLVQAGNWSYSLYLIHSPIIGITNMILLPIHMPLVVRFALLACIALPIAGLASYAFHCLVERRFMTSHQQSLRTAGHV
ncbi:acyltransferase [Curtobacterium sp. MCJR17_055]|uniref:acyltransferase family protein n=1 Tax=unclassified Curtobacterium TaxID=257496 RepID=UPI000D92E209|nr:MULTISPECIES: acyltransferase [unclassified Curtobacterium]PYY36722.1 acyltransferase [Curtobacterium sp. MCBD17_029]PYY58618.1 acyltransferase [Curtobacterium sp. MCJR17_055]PYY59841.1 acyltransferase [Curtobacterium sp. MCPF17_015]